MSKVIIGTAGHVDHGKTTLIRNLTGTDTDRLIEEKQRGLTIDLGFAFLNDDISFIDVPGHEKFIKNMVAGAATVNFVMLVIAADDGIMAQTREHFEIVKFLGIKNGIIVLTKTDLVSPDTLKLRHQQIQDFVIESFLEGNLIFPVTSAKDEQIERLKQYLKNLSTQNFPDRNHQIFKMPIDRAFTIKGFGNVITGTVTSGTFQLNGKNLMIYPEMFPVTIRNIETQNHEVSEISANQRCALNIKHDKKYQLYRGQLLSEANNFTTTKIITCRLKKSESVKALKFGSKVRFHINTGEYFATLRTFGANSISDNESHIVQFQFEEEITMGFKDKFIIRHMSPIITIGGGKVLDVNPQKLKKSNTAVSEKYQILYSDDDIENIYNFLLIYSYLGAAQLQIKFSQNISFLNPILEKLITEKRILKIDKYYFSDKNFVIHRKNILKETKKILQTTNTSELQRAQLYSTLNLDESVIDALLDSLINSKELVQREGMITLPEKQEISSQDKIQLNKILQLINRARYQLNNFTQLMESSGLCRTDFQRYFNLLKSMNKIIILDNSFVISQKLLNDAEKIIQEYLTKNDQAKVTELKQLLSTTRRYIMPLLKYFDEYLLERDGDFRRLK